MVKLYVVSAGMKLRGTGLLLLTVNLPQAVHIDLQGVDGGQIDEVSAHGFVDTGHHNQEAEERQHVQFAPHQQDTPRQGGSGNPKFQQHLGGHHIERRFQLALQGPLFHQPHLPSQIRQIRFLGVGAFQVPGTLHILGNPLRKV